MAAEIIGANRVTILNRGEYRRLIAEASTISTLTRPREALLLSHRGYEVTAGFLGFEGMLYTSNDSLDLTVDPRLQVFQQCLILSRGGVTTLVTGIENGFSTRICDPTALEFHGEKFYRDISLSAFNGVQIESFQIIARREELKS